MISFRRSNYFKIRLAVRDVAVALPTFCLDEIITKTTDWLLASR
jgi:hypothetical protein